mgnify:FL=1
MGTFVNIVLIVAGLVAIFLMGGIPSLLIALVVCTGLAVYNYHRENIRRSNELFARWEQAKKDRA